LRFASGSGHAPKVEVNLDQVTFDGPLNFINPLAQYLMSLGGGGLSVAVQGGDVTASTSVALPDVPVGIFQLSGLSFAGGVVLPLVGGLATASFSFASQDNPFNLSVAMFGGGGFISLALGFGGVQSVQGALEFSGQFALDLGVASGSLSLVAGVYYSYTSPDATPAGNGTELTGFVRVAGQLTVLGILTISASLDLMLEYASDGNSVWGSATLMVGVSVCGIGKTVSITVSKSFAGPPQTGTTTSAATMSAARRRTALRAASGDPGSGSDSAIGWVHLVPDAGTWSTYCGAFGTGVLNR
jgi:hypothetical protein